MGLSKTEQRLAKLERELAFVKAQGLTKDEQEVLLNQESAPFFKNHSNKLVWLIILIQFFLIIYLIMKMEDLNQNFKSSSQDIENQAEGISIPKRDQPFILP